MHDNIPEKKQKEGEWLSRLKQETAKELGLSGRILDVGCGEGYYSARLADALGAELTGLDISKEAVRCAAAKYKGKQWICATAAHIPVEDGSADLVIRDPIGKVFGQV